MKIINLSKLNFCSFPTILFKLLFILLFILVGVSIFAQRAPADFAPVGAKWHYRGFSSTGDIPLITIVSEKDTLIEMNVCQKVFVYLNDETNPVTHYIFYESNRQVFFYEGGLFKMLYDFNLEVGDTLYSYQPSNRVFVDFTACPEEADTSIQCKSIVENISYDVINGDSLKTLSMGFNGTPFFFNDIKERVGSMNGLFGRFEMICPTNDEGLVRCYEDERYAFNFTNEPCDLLSSTKELQNSSALTVYPNPVQERVYWDSDEKIESARVYNLLGKLIGRFSLVSNISTDGWSRGWYIIVFELKNGEQVARRVRVKI